MINIETYKLGLYNQNCYVVSDQTKEAVVIDPGANNYELFTKLNSEYKIKYILLTHSHFDHVTGTDMLKEISGAQVCIYEGEEKILDRAGTPDVLLKDSDIISFGEQNIRVMHTPGHTAGSACFIVGDNIFSGDMLFKGTVGRTDLPTGNYPEILRSVKKLNALDGNYNVFTGHDDCTTLDAERKYNMYFKDAVDESDFY